MTPELNDMAEDGWNSLEPAAKNLMFWFGALPFLIPVIPAIILPMALMPDGWGFAVTLPVAVACLALGFTHGRNRWLYTRWRLEDGGFRLRKGHWWQSEVFVPRSRVQHLDIHNGPMERKRNLATLVIHTAGTQSHALKQEGFSLQTATRLRDALIPETRRDDSAL
jgi:membrane protein YdbS with pleckstrin-like domain